MKPRRWLARVALALAGLLLVACQGGIYSGTLVFDGVHRFGAGDRLPGDVALRAGTAEFAAGSRVDGAIYVVGGTLRFDGETGGDLVVLDGSVTLGPNSVIGGDLRLGGGQVSQAQGAVVRGQTLSTALALPATEPQPRDLGSLARGLLGSVLLASLAGLWARFWPRAPKRIGQAAVRAWPAALGLGVLALLTLPVLLVMMAFTIVLIPLVFAMGGLVLLVLGMGMAALGLRLAGGLAARLGRPLSPARAAFAGTLALALLFQAPLAGQALFITLSLWMCGAVLLARFGTRDFQLPGPAAGPDDPDSYARPVRA